MIYQAVRRADRKRHRAGNRMIYVHDFHGERAEFHHVAGFYHALRHILNTAFLQFVVRKHQSQLRAINGCAGVQLFHKIRHAADMIFMPVS